MVIGMPQYNLLTIDHQFLKVTIQDIRYTQYNFCNWLIWLYWTESHPLEKGPNIS